MLEVCSSAGYCRMLGVGEALVSFLNEQGIPQMVKRCNIIAPRCAMGAYARG